MTRAAPAAKRNSRATRPSVSLHYTPLIIFHKIKYYQKMLGQMVSYITANI